MIRKLTIVALAAFALCAALPAASANAQTAPPGFTVGISPQTPADKVDYGLMQEAGVRSLRLPLTWASVEEHSPYLVAPDWSGFDHSVELAAEYGMRVFPFVWGTPSWVAGQQRIEPVRSGWARRAWASFLRQAVRRYGPYGEFWSEHPELEARPIREWEIWNEENIVTFGDANPRRFARVMRVAGRAIHGADRGAKVILGGLFGRPLQIPPNAAPGDYLNRFYRAGHVKRFFDGIALHPYVADAGAMRPMISNLRRVMRRHHDAATPLYLTEMGWGSDSYQTRWERGFYGQARELQQAFSMLTSHRRSWRIAGAWWFTWADTPERLCQFCDSAGLLTPNREAKPAWYRFVEWTGGEAEIVPRASFGG